MIRRSLAELAAEAEPVARKFLEARTIDEILPLIRNPEIGAEQLKAAYPDGTVPAEGLSEFNLHSATISGRFVSFSVRTRDFVPKTLVFVEEPDGLKIDWESSVGWSEMAWDEFLETKPTSPKVFRLIFSPVEYYNFEFRDDLKWQSYQLESPDKQHAVYGYVEKGSVLDEQLRLDPETKSKAIMLSLGFPEGTASPNQVVIERLVADGWIEQDPQP